MSDPVPITSNPTATPAQTLTTTFYSFKGGVGRSAALFGVARRLAAGRRRVLVVDGDLEAPGLSLALLSREQTHSCEGLAELAIAVCARLLVCARDGVALAPDYLAELAKRLSEMLKPLETPPAENPELLQRLARELPQYPVRQTGALALLAAGRIYADYPGMIEQIPLSRVYGHALREKEGAVLPEYRELVRSAGCDPDSATVKSLGDLLAALLRQAFHKATVDGESFDYVLVDSRTGLADIAGFCVKGLADKVVLVSGLNQQNVEGARWLLSQLPPARRGPDSLIPVVSPVPEGELELLARRTEEWQKASGLPPGHKPLSLHYHPRLALIEDPFTDVVTRLARIASDYDELAGRVRALNQDLPQQWLSRAVAVMTRPLTEAETGEAPHQVVMADLVEAALGVPDQVARLCRAVGGNDEVQRGQAPLLMDFLRLLAALEDKDAAVWGALGTSLGSLAQQEYATQPAAAAAHFAEAFAKYQQAVAIKPDKHLAWYNWGRDLGALARLEYATQPAAGAAHFAEAFAKYQQAVTIKPDKHEAWNNWGHALGSLARIEYAAQPVAAAAHFAEAFAKYQQAITIKPDKHEAWYNWGIDLGGLARLEYATQPAAGAAHFAEAFAKYQQAVTIKPDLHEAWGGMAFLHEVLAWLVAQGKLAGDPGHLAEAARCWAECRRLSADSAQYGQAAAAAQTGRPEEALRLLSDLCSRDPKAAARAGDDTEFEPLYGLPSFRALCAAAKKASESPPSTA